MNRTTIRPTLVIADQPTEDELRSLPSDGFTAVINLRRPGEPDRPLEPSAEGELLQELGLDYLGIPVGGEPLGEAQVAEIVGLIDRHERERGKVLLHCKQGGRAAGLALLHLAGEEGWQPDEVIDRGRVLGLELPPPVRTLIEAYLAR